MKILFLGTRGEIKPKTRRHAMHTSTLFIHRGKRVLIDCGESWLGKLEGIQPDHIVLTHAHPDHAYGLKEGAPCPVWATAETWKLIENYPILRKQRRVIQPREPRRIGGIQIEAFPLLHSIRCPAVGYRIVTGRIKLFYAPDVAYIPDLEEAFEGIQAYIGDGATIVRNMIRKKGEQIFGHAAIRQELTWCQKTGVARMIITHCGSDIVKNEKKALKQIKKLSDERGIEVLIAHDGLQLEA